MTKTVGKVLGVAILLLITTVIFVLTQGKTPTPPATQQTDQAQKSDRSEATQSPTPPAEPKKEDTGLPWPSVLLGWLLVLIATGFAFKQIFDREVSTFKEKILPKPGFRAIGVVLGLIFLALACTPRLFGKVVTDHPGGVILTILATIVIAHFLNHKSWVGKLVASGVGLIVLVNLTDGINWWGGSNRNPTYPRRESNRYSSGVSGGKYTSRGIDFSDAPKNVVLREIATCESGNSHFNQDGSVKHNQTDREDSWGEWQINMKDPAVRALMEKSGLDPKKEGDNRKAAELIYDSEGLKPWIGDKPCWELSLQKLGYGRGGGQQRISLPYLIRIAEVGTDWGEKIPNPRLSYAQLSWGRLDTSKGGKCEVRFDGDESQIHNIRDSLLETFPDYLQFRCSEEGAIVQVRAVAKQF